MIFRITKTKGPNETLWMCVDLGFNKFPSGQTRWCILANPKVYPPLHMGEKWGILSHYIAINHFFVGGWQLCIRSNLFKPPLRELTFSTLTHFAVWECDRADLLCVCVCVCVCVWGGVALVSLFISTQAVHCATLGGTGEGNRGEQREKKAPNPFFFPFYRFPLNMLHQGVK